MNTTQLLLTLWDKAEAGRIAATVQRQIHDAVLLDHACGLAELIGFSQASPDAQSAWHLLVLGRSPRDIVWILHLLRQHKVSFDKLYAVMPTFGTSDLGTVGKVIESLGGPFSNN